MWAGAADAIADVNEAYDLSVLTREFQSMLGLKSNKAK